MGSRSAYLHFGLQWSPFLRRIDRKQRFSKIMPAEIEQLPIKEKESIGANDRPNKQVTKNEA